MANKILVAGDVGGNFNSLFARVGKVHTSKAGPFHALFCVGAFFGRKGRQELDEYIQGKKQVPLPTYFIAGDEFEASLIDSLPAGGQLCPNLHYLGRRGVTSLSLGGAAPLNVAFLSGVYDQSSYFNTMAATGGVRNTRYQPHYIEEDVVSVLASGVSAEVDILLTAEWGRSWQSLTPAEKVPASLQGPAANGSPVVSKLASQLSARYHFAGTQDAYFELAPYRSRVFVTRFFGLAAVDSPKKEKYLYACNVAPFAVIDKNAVPADATACPYTVGNKPPAAAAAAAAGVAPPTAAHSHPFPSDVESNKRQRLDSGFTDPRAAPSAAVLAGDAVGLATHRWNFVKPTRGPPPPHYVCRICQEPGHWVEDCPRKVDRDRDTPPEDYTCRKCNQKGHYIRQCPLIEAEIASGVRTPRPPPSDYLCAKCSTPGHWIKDCPLLAAERATPGALPAGYICKVCQQPGHRIQDCEVVKKENAERDARRAAGRPPPGYVCAKCQVPDQHFVHNCPTHPRSAPLLPGGPGATRQLDANGMPLGTDQSCWFCLATEHVSTHLILSVGNENYLALAKGALNPEHVLILPIVHVASSLELTPEQAVEMDKYKLALRRYYRSKGLECIMYERYIPTRAAQHMHIQIVPVTRDQAKNAKALLHAQAKALSEHLTFQEIPRTNTLSQANPGKQPFIVFELPAFDDDAAAAASSSTAASASADAATEFPLDRLIHYVHHRQKIFGLFDFPRSLAAAVIDRPDLSDWKKCTVSEAEETDIVEKMKTTFSSFDFTIEPEEQQATATTSE